MIDLGLTGRVAAVAAASEGLGFATARALRQAGVTVAIAARRNSRLIAAAEEIGATPIQHDVATPEGAAGFVASVRESLGAPDIVIPNAGGPPLTTHETTSMDQYRDAIAANLLAVIAMCEEALPHMTAQRWGRIVAITSISARQPIEGLILSNTARAGVTGYLKTLAAEVAGAGVTVNSLQPGFHRTRRLQDSDDPAVLGRIPAGRLGEPADFGAVAAFLCSEQAGYVTGAALPVDGGYSRGLM